MDDLKSRFRAPDPGNLTDLEVQALGKPETAELLARSGQAPDQLAPVRGSHRGREPQAAADAQGGVSLSLAPQLPGSSLKEKLNAPPATAAIYRA